MTKAMRVGLIGAAWGTTAHLPALRSVPGIEVVAVCTAHRDTAERAAAEHGIDRAYWSVERLLGDPEIDVVDVCTRPSFRREMIPSALEAGKHVLSEVPVATNAEDAHMFARLAQEHGAKTLINMNTRHCPSHIEMARRIGAGFIGQPVVATGQLLLPMFGEGESAYPEYDWLQFREHGASALRNLTAHQVDTVRMILGEFAEVSGSSAPVEFGAVDVDELRSDDAAVLSGRLLNGTLVSLASGWSLGQGSWILDIHGTEGRLRASAPFYPDPGNCGLVGGQHGEEESPIEAEFPQEFRSSVDVDASLQGFAYGAWELGRAIRGEAEAAYPNFDDGAAVSLVTETAEKTEAAYLDAGRGGAA